MKEKQPSATTYLERVLCAKEFKNVEYKPCSRLKENRNENVTARKIQGCNQKFPDWVDNEIHAYNNNKHSLTSNIKGYGGKIH
jgi:uncharacterized protein YcbK (DUF882 family)